MRGLILVNGEPPTRDICVKYANASDLLICADGAAGYAAVYGLEPHIVIGDMDSVHDSVLDRMNTCGTEIIRYNKRKDETDTELAIELAISKGCKSLVILGGLGRRFDHCLGNASLLYYLAKKGIQAQMIDCYNSIEIITGEYTACGNIGDTISLIPFTDDVFITATEGLEYPIYLKPLQKDYTLGISNILSSETYRVIIKTGYVMLVKVHKLHNNCY